MNPRSGILLICLLATSAAIAEEMDFPGLALAQGLNARGAAVLYRNAHGRWMVTCKKNPITDLDRDCSLATAQGPFGAQTVIGVWRNTPDGEDYVMIENSMATPNREVVVRADSNPPITIPDAYNHGQVVVGGDERDRILDEWSNAKQIVTQVYTQSGAPITHTFSAEGFVDW
jgi:hypothetical protein